MDSNSNSCELPWTKIEIDPDNDSQVKREPRWHWTPENTQKLIEVFEKDCKELWDTKHPLNRDKSARQAKHEYLANMFDTTSDEVSRKLHNLRTQFNNELRKIKRKQAGGEYQGNSGWEYFDSLSFLMREPLIDPLDTAVEGVNLALAEFQADEELEFGLVRSRVTGSPVARKPVQRVAASAPRPPKLSTNPLLWPEQPRPKIKATLKADECQIFGDFVASELRTLRSDAVRRKLKRIIQKAILQVEDEEDVNIING